LLKGFFKHGAVLPDVEASEMEAKGVCDLDRGKDIFLSKASRSDRAQRPSHEREIINQLLGPSVAMRLHLCSAERYSRPDQVEELAKGLARIPMYSAVGDTPAVGL
jgi:hypothetical protein